jgi:hypothetical protein
VIEGTQKYMVYDVLIDVEIPDDVRDRSWLYNVQAYLGVGRLKDGYATRFNRR